MASRAASAALFYAVTKFLFENEVYGGRCDLAQGGRTRYGLEGAVLERGSAGTIGAE
jgi:hypothetical protein